MSSSDKPLKMVTCSGCESKVFIPGDLPPLACLELFSIAPLMTAGLYRELGRNAGRHARGLRPVPVRNPYTDQAIEARYHAEVVSLVAVERSESQAGVAPVDVEVER